MQNKKNYYKNKLVLIVFAINLILFLSSCNQKITINFNSNGGSEVKSIVLASGSSVTIPTPPFKEGYDFAGWYIDAEFSELYEFTIMPENDITLYARWVEYRTITFDSDGGSAVQPLMRGIGLNIESPDNPVKEGYEFLGWYLENSVSEISYEFDIMPDNNFTLYAHWAKLCSITFESNGGSETESVVRGAGVVIDAPEVPIKEEYEFGGWYIDEELTEAFDFYHMPDNDTILYARWCKTYMISFITNGGEALNPIQRGESLKINAPATERDGYDFEGWYGDEALTLYSEDFVMPAEDINLYADWGTIGLAYSIYGYISCTVDKGTSSSISTSIRIPNRHEGIPITNIHSFRGASMFYIRLPDFLCSIEERAFADCTLLREITIPASVTTISNYVFENITAKVIFEEGSCLKELHAFTGYKGESVTIPYGVTKISAFDSCTNLKEVTISESVTEISKDTFSGCNKLDSLLIPASVTNIGEYAFKSVSGDINFAENTKISKIPENAFGSYFGKSFCVPNSVKTIEYGAFSSSEIRSITLPEGLTSIGSKAFADCHYLSITIPSSVTEIGSGAFSSISGQIVFSPGSALTQIGDGVFSGYKGKEISIPEGILSFGENAFSFCSNLVNFVIGERVVSLGNSCFANCTKLESFIVGEGVVSLGNSCFANCTALETITLSSTVETIGTSILSGCFSLKEITVAPENQFYKSIDGVLYDKDITTILAYNTMSDRIIFNIPNTITVISPYIFEKARFKAVIIPDSVTEIKNDAFFDCYYLEQIEIPSSVTTIEYEAFKDCDSLRRIVLGDGITSFSSSSISSCDKLLALIINRTSEQGILEISRFAFDYLYYLKIYVDSSSVEDYKADSNWSHYSDIIYSKSIIDENGFAISESTLLQYTGLEKDIEIPEGIETIAENAFACSLAETIIIPEGVFEIHNAFIKSNISNLSFPESLTLLGSEAFDLCEKLQSITINSNIQITNSMFYKSGVLRIIFIELPSSEGIIELTGGFDSYNYPQLRIYVPNQITASAYKNSNVWSNRAEIIYSKEIIDNEGFVIEEGVLISYAGNAANIVIPSEVTSIGAYAFKNVSGSIDYEEGSLLTEICNNAFDHYLGASVNLPDGITIIGNCAFTYSYNLASFKMPSNLISIGDQAFYNCTSLISINIPDSVTAIGYSAFSQCYNLTEIILGNGISELPIGIFSNCSNLESIVVPENVTIIQNAAFSYCSSLSDISLPSDLSIIMPNVFIGCSSLDHLELPTSVIYIGYDAFVFTGIISNAPQDTLVYIGNWLVTAKGNRAILDVEEGTIGIVSGAFRYRCDIKKVLLPESLLYIGDFAFQGMNNIEIYVNKPSSEGIIIIGESIFDLSITGIYFTDSTTLFAYSEAENWSEYTNKMSIID